MFMPKTLKDIIANNARRLIEHKYKDKEKPLSQTAIGELIGISQRSVSYLFDDKNAIESIRSDTIEKIADHFGLEPYHLMIPNLPLEELMTRRIEKVIECYSQVPIEGRENITRVAENEVRYCSNHSPPIHESINGG